MNNNINSVLYKVYHDLHNTLAARIVHRRRRKSSDCIEIIFLSAAIDYLSGHQNTLPKAEKCGFFVICRAQRGKHAFYRGHQVFQLFLTPVHPKKVREQQPQTTSNDLKQYQTTSNNIKPSQTTSESVTFVSIPAIPTRRFRNTPHRFGTIIVKLSYIK